MEKHADGVTSKEVSASSQKPNNQGHNMLEWLEEPLSLFHLRIKLLDRKERAILLYPAQEISEVRFFISASHGQETDYMGYQMDLMPRNSRNTFTQMELSSGRIMSHGLAQPLVSNQRFMMSKILMWNVQGAGSSAFREHLLEQVNFHQPGILIIVETKLSGRAAVQMLERLPFTDSCIIDSMGLKGGMWILWNEQDVKLDVLDKTY